MNWRTADWSCEYSLRNTAELINSGGCVAYITDAVINQHSFISPMTSLPFVWPNGPDLFEFRAFQVHSTPWIENLSHLKTRTFNKLSLVQSKETKKAKMEGKFDASVCLVN